MNEFEDHATEARQEWLGTPRAMKYDNILVVIGLTLLLLAMIFG